MANPFQAHFYSRCYDCKEGIEEGDTVFVDDGEFICAPCAALRDVICNCGKYKKQAFNFCYNCYMKGQKKEKEETHYYYQNPYKKYYDILEISEYSSQKEIQKAFHKLAHKHHPDKGGDEKMFKKINEAYQTLIKK